MATFTDILFKTAQVVLFISISLHSISVSATTISNHITLIQSTKRSPERVQLQALWITSTFLHQGCSHKFKYIASGQLYILINLIRLLSSTLYFIYLYSILVSSVLIWSLYICVSEQSWKQDLLNISRSSSCFCNSIVLLFFPTMFLFHSPIKSFSAK